MFFNEPVSFTLQNGAAILSMHFSSVKRYDYEDSLLITNTTDLLKWIESAMLANKLSETDLAVLYDCFESIRSKEGAISIPKEVGIFISKK